MREMFSSISVPPRSLTPQRRPSVAASSPIFTQLAWRFVIVSPSASRKAAVCLRFSSRRDLLDPVRAPEHRVERDEAERHELGDPPGALLKLAHDPHVLRQLPGLLDVAEHHRRGRAQARPVGGLDDLHPASERAACWERSARARRRGAPRPPCRESSRARSRAGTRRRPRGGCPSARTCSGPPSASRREGGLAAPPAWRAAASARSPRACSRGGCRPACRSPSRRTRPPRPPCAANSSSSDVVGVGRAAPLAEAAEGAADHADVGEVDVAVDDEGDPSPASSARSSSAASRISSITSGRVSANSAVSSSSVSASPSRPLSIAPGARSGSIRRSLRRPDPRRGMKLQYLSLITSSTPCSIHSGSMYCG